MSINNNTTRNNNMSMHEKMIRSVLDNSVKYNMTPSDIVKLVNSLFEALDWYHDMPCTIEHVIDCVKSEVDNKEVFNKWLELHNK